VACPLGVSTDDPAIREAWATAHAFLQTSIRNGGYHGGNMNEQQDRPSGLTRLSYDAFVWLYRLHLGFLFAGHVFVIAHHGRKSGKRYLSGLEPLVRSEGELIVFSSRGRRADWLRNIEAGGVDELWDGRTRYDGAEFRVIEPVEAYDILTRYEQEQPGNAKRNLPRMMTGYDFSDEMRRQLAETGTIVAFGPEWPVETRRHLVPATADPHGEPAQYRHPRVRRAGVVERLLALYFFPGSRYANSVGVFKAWERSKEDPEVHDLVRYLVCWVAGTKLIFLALLLVILLTADTQGLLYAGLALAISISSFFWRLFPLARKMDREGQVDPAGYSAILGVMIAAIVLLLVVALLLTSSI
jgi:deazaflavin-dependent oxidoreductase (nitroreductase family)